MISVLWNKEQSMAKNSVFVRALLWIYAVLAESKAVRFLSGCIRAVGVALGESLPGRFLRRETGVERHAETSLFYRGLSAVWNGVLRFFEKIYGWLSRKNEGSVNRRFFDSVLQNSYILHLETLLCLSVFVIFIVPHDMWNNLYATLLTAGLVGMYFLCLLSGKRALGKNAAAIWFPFLFFVFSTLISIVGSPTMGDSIRTLAFFVTAFGMCLLLYGTLSTYEKVEHFLKYIVLLVGATAAYAVVQRILGVEADASLTDLSLNKGMPGRVFSTLGNPNNYAEFLMLMIPFAFAFFLSQEKRGWKAVSLGAVLLGIVALLLTYSRSGWLAFMVALIVFTALYNWRLLPVLCLVGLLCIPLLPESILNRILTIGNLSDSSSSYRIDIWTGSLRMLRDGYWLGGTGLGAEAFTSVYPSYGVGASRIAPHTHMQFMEILAEMGLIGLISILWLSISLIRRTAVKARKAKPRLRAVLCAASSAMAGISAIGFAEYTWFYPRVMLAFFVAAGISMACVRIAAREKE